MPIQTDDLVRLLSNRMGGMSAHERAQILRTLADAPGQPTTASEEARVPLALADHKPRPDGVEERADVWLEANGNGLTIAFPEIDAAERPGALLHNPHTIITRHADRYDVGVFADYDLIATISYGRDGVVQFVPTADPHTVVLYRSPDADPARR